MAFNIDIILCDKYQRVIISLSKVGYWYIPPRAVYLSYILWVYYTSISVNAFSLVLQKLVVKMTPDFTDTLKLFLTISKISGLINFCCTLESGLLFRDTRLTYHLFLEGLRMFVYLICTYHICYNMGLNYIFLQFNVVKYWCIIIAARMSEKWIIRYMNSFKAYINCWK